MGSRSFTALGIVVAAVLTALIACTIATRDYQSGRIPSSTITDAPSVSSVSTVDEHDPLGQPESRTRALQILKKPHFTIGYDNDKREPAWTSYHLAGPIVFHDKEHRPTRFVPDPEVQTSMLQKDLLHTGYDCGHLTPAHAIFSRFGQDAMEGTFITSNIVPQMHAMNIGPWKRVETLIAGTVSQDGGWAERYREVWVTDGPIFTDQGQSLPAGEPIPTACFMVVLRHDGPRWAALAFEIPNRQTQQPTEQYLVTIDRIEQDSGLDLYGALPDAEEDALEAEGLMHLWP